MSRITPAYFPANRALGLRFLGALLSLLPFCATWLEAASLGTAFTYQGRLSSSTGPAAGWFDLRFALFDAGSAGSQTGPALTNSAVGVTNGLFAATLDFGTTVFDGTARWLEIGVRTNGNGAFTTLTPRQPLTPVPYALFAPVAAVAGSATSAGSVANGGVTGPAIASGQVVKSLNGLHDAVVLAAGANLSLATNGNSLMLSAAGGGTNGGWATTGNAGTSPTVQFLGTTDGQPLVIKANNVGINTNNPQAALHVNGAVQATRFVGDGSGLTNVPAAPFTFSTLARTNDGGFALGLAVAGHYAYLANGYDGLRVYDISDITHPVNVGYYSDFSWDATAVALTGSIAFVASDTLYVLDVSSPAQPVTVSKAPGSYYTYGVAVAGKVVYVAANADGLMTYIYDNGFTNLAGPTGRGHIDNGGRARGVAVSGNFAYLANDTDGLRIYNVANPANPVNISHINSGGQARGVAVSGNFAYLANNDDGLRIYNISNPASPVSVGHIYQAGYAYGVALSGRYAFVANYDDGLRAYDVSDPAHPSPVGAAPIVGDGFAMAVATSGNYVFSANEIGGLATYFAAPLATVPGVVGASGFLGDAFGLTNLNAGQLTGQLAAPILAGLWQSTGNAGTTPAQNFVGTTDSQPLELRANNQPALRLEPGGNVVVDPADANDGGLAPGLTFGVASGAGIASKRTAGGNQFGLDFFTDRTSRLSIESSGVVHIGGPWLDALLDIEANTQLNDHDLFLRGGSELGHGLGWYGDVKPFGVNYPDGPVLYGNRGGVLGTTVNGPDASLIWDQNQVAVTKDLTAARNLHVAGDITASGQVAAQSISAGNTPGVNWAQDAAATSQTAISDETTLATCANARPAPGFFVITASAAVSVNAFQFILKLVDTTDPANPVELAETTIMDSDPGVLLQAYQTSAHLSWVVPIPATGPKQTFSLVGRTDGGTTTVKARNLTVMYFPRQNN